MENFINDNFLLNTKTAAELYHNYAKDMPIYDYHCHLSPKEIAENKRYENITELWLAEDHYKWRAMRANGIEEKFITGNASDYDKFKAWAKTVPYCIGNPLYHWTHLELKRYFNINILLNEETADEIWERTNEKLNEKEFSAKKLIKSSNVKVICTTDDAIDTLKYHREIKKDKKFCVKVLPTLRPDKGIKIESKVFIPWVNKLAEISNTKINNYEDLIRALEVRVKFFHEEGCRLSDHSIEKSFFKKATDNEVNKIFLKAMRGERLSQIEIDKYKTRIMLDLAKMYKVKGWTMQLHIGAMRNNNSKMFRKLGPDAGFDSIGDEKIAQPLSKILDEIDNKIGLPKTILYCLNPAYNEVIATIAGNFQGGKVPSKLQFGPAWWFNDYKYGIIRQIVTLANMGLLSRFVGMVTDSRSFLSYVRHEYFRRILCDLLGTWAEKGEVPYDLELLGTIIKDICFYNARDYFGIEI